jgi:hypothetical protein
MYVIRLQVRFLLRLFQPHLHHADIRIEQGTTSLFIPADKDRIQSEFEE